MGMGGVTELVGECSGVPLSWVKLELHGHRHCGDPATTGVGGGLRVCVLPHRISTPLLTPMDPSWMQGPQTPIPFEGGTYCCSVCHLVGLSVNVWRCLRCVCMYVLHVCGVGGGREREREGERGKEREGGREGQKGRGREEDFDVNFKYK